MAARTVTVYAKLPSGRWESWRVGRAGFLRRLVAYDTWRPVLDFHQLAATPAAWKALGVRPGSTSNGVQFRALSGAALRQLPRVEYARP